MSKIKQKININESEDARIRRIWDEERQRWYFSITDIIAVLTDSVDSRNYWKVLKNRLKKTQEQLVSECNQLKLPSTDGKNYMADVADKETLLKIIRTIDPSNVAVFKSWLEHVEIKNDLKKEKIDPEKNQFNQNKDTEPVLENIEEEKFSTVLEAPVDIYEKNEYIFIQFMLPGVDPEKIILSVSMQTLTIKGLRILNEIIKKDNSEKKYLFQELQWGHFYRQIKLPCLVDTDQIQTNEFQGLITIKLIKIDINKNRFIKIKSKYKIKLLF
ncbi:MAG: Hsp20 family protein [Minisyncoccia bacterium]